MASPHYTRQFYEEHRAGAEQSARVILPLVLDLLHPQSVLDVGCGDGNWLSVFRDLGVGDILGIDGDYVQRDLLQIPSERFRPMDLAKPFSVGRTFDLAVSLEVAEHLPASSATGFVRSLTEAAPAVLFSAAIPNQGGENHVNEQWPEFWASLFRQNGFVAIDAFRRRVWHNDAVDWWYAQNILLFVRIGVAEQNPPLKAELDRTVPSQLTMIHPRQFVQLSDRYQNALEHAQQANAHVGVFGASRLLATSLKKVVRRRLLGRP